LIDEVKTSMAEIDKKHRIEEDDLDENGNKRDCHNQKKIEVGTKFPKAMLTKNKKVLI